MKIMLPQLPKQFIEVDDFSAYAKPFLAEEDPVSAMKSCATHTEATDFFKIEIEQCLFDSCVFHHCSFENASFVDVVFQSCDLSNSKFCGAYFERCQFLSCKSIGIDMSGAVLKHTSFSQCNVRYANFDHCKIASVLFDHVDFTASSMTEANLKRFEANDTKFDENNFFRTMLATIDFSKNDLRSPLLSSPPVELKGATVSMSQAADLIALWGIIVRP
ncbi:MAG: pentapeptide repeat-containing protein [Oscillospiraceae bacterium]